MVDYVNQKLKAWIMRKYKRFRLHKTGASLFLRKLARNPEHLSQANIEFEYRQVLHR
ncbi:hypothetical protein HAP41_0000044460 [Bradyrhizobium barranii subsp. apii]|uniref:Group II intron maturase-specific domain-containing protein n=1 Tax=Bradyrhizobium barranii subsp. apii TaxID=2819348 RepID=A0A8U0FZK6_9BRAD|nr:hypothetical protein HAP41_0000044460 [Bradyrhizobium barranii subsp. apii]